MTRSEQEQLYIENEDLAYYTLNKYFPADALDEDYQQEARILLWKACCRFIPGKVSFSTFAVTVISNGIKSLYAMEHRQRRGGFNTKLELDAEDCPKSALPFTCFEWVDYMGFLAAIRPKDALLVKMAVNGYTRKEIARHIGVSRQAVDKRIGSTRAIFDRYV